MKLKSFRVRNYRSIKDSGICYVSGDNVTILAGKNEAGKTAILEALEDFNTGRNIREDAIHIFQEDPKPEITVTFEIDEGTLQKIFDQLGVEANSSKPVDVEITKRYPKQYTLSEESKKTISMREVMGFESKEKLVREMYSSIKKYYSQYPDIANALPKLDMSDTQTFAAKLQGLKNRERKLALIPNERDRAALTKDIEQLLQTLEGIINVLSIEANLAKEIEKRIPNFILFSSFDDVFPSEIPLNEAINNALVKDLDAISNLDLNLIKTGRPSIKRRHKDELNVRLEERYRKFWTQDLTSLSVDWDSEKLYFWVKEDSQYYPPDKRSKGKQWHLAFYIRVSARSREDIPNIILIDEPGYCLHAQAQKDIISALEDAADHVPIIFCTHSPYLIDTNKLNRIRLVSRNVEEGTVISNKVHKSADKETLTPIITAIGLDLSMGLDIAKNNNILVEGITDYYYLCALKEFHKFKEEVHFIPCVGADKFNFIVPLMIGWGFNYCVVLDNDDKGRNVEQKLKNAYSHTDIKTTFVSPNKDEEIEDLFARADFIKYVLNDESIQIPTEKLNSQWIKKSPTRYDSVLLSKIFFEKCHDGTIKLSSLSSETTQAFKELLAKIDRLLFRTGED